MMGEQGALVLGIWGCYVHCATLQYQLPAPLLPGAASFHSSFRQVTISPAPLLTTMPFFVLLLFALSDGNRS